MRLFSVLQIECPTISLSAGRGMSLEKAPHHSRLQKSQSFGFNSSSSAVTSVQSRAAVKSRSSSCEDLVKEQKMFQRPKPVDPLASLPTSHSKQYQRTFSGGSPPPGPHSPSPSQSEYDTCDPWDDY